ncbi:hypothetical protein D5018_00185 [Parashewanella curva]|uniref:Uncharacterized protein n=1 Tax=Parashewanella curva TaxID=2338552 RepID=A0A3L8Q3T5_9GAMM|nr:hypothetical protein [Parashewanella curva]RLV61572.1 hypothetical protein D5018_00185 [Parashewanella curva]
MTAITFHLNFSLEWYSLTQSYGALTRTQLHDLYLIFTEEPSTYSTLILTFLDGETFKAKSDVSQKKWMLSRRNFMHIYKVDSKCAALDFAYQFALRKYTKSPKVHTNTIRSVPVIKQYVQQDTSTNSRYKYSSSSLK